MIGLDDFNLAMAALFLAWATVVAVCVLMCAISNSLVRRRAFLAQRLETATYQTVPVYVHDLPPFIRQRFPLRSRISGSRVLA